MHLTDRHLLDQSQEIMQDIRHYRNRPVNDDTYNEMCKDVIHRFSVLRALLAQDTKEQKEADECTS